MDSIALTGLDQLIADQPGTSRPDAYRYLGFSIRETTGLAGELKEGDLWSCPLPVASA